MGAGHVGVNGSVGGLGQEVEQFLGVEPSGVGVGSSLFGQEQQSWVRFN